MSLPAEFGTQGAGIGPPTWQRLSECPRCIAYRPNLVRTAVTALAVGTVLFLINHLATVLSGDATTGVWAATAASFVVPFCVSNVGLLVALRRDPSGPSLAGGALTGPAGARGDGSRSAPTWQRVSEWPRCIIYRPHLVRTVATALVVGTGYFAINQLATVLAGHATAAVWVESGVTYLVPFCVSNMGVLVGCHRGP